MNVALYYRNSPQDELIITEPKPMLKMNKPMQANEFALFGLTVGLGFAARPADSNHPLNNLSVFDVIAGRMLNENDEIDTQGKGLVVLTANATEEEISARFADECTTGSNEKKTEITFLKIAPAAARKMYKKAFAKPAPRTYDWSHAYASNDDAILVAVDDSSAVVGVRDGDEWSESELYVYWEEIDEEDSDTMDKLQRYAEKLLESRRAESDWENVENWKEILEVAIRHECDEMGDDFEEMMKKYKDVEESGKEDLEIDIPKYIVRHKSGRYYIASFEVLFAPPSHYCETFLMFSRGKDGQLEFYAEFEDGEENEQPDENFLYWWAKECVG